MPLEEGFVGGRGTGSTGGRVLYYSILPFGLAAAHNRRSICGTTAVGDFSVPLIDPLDPPFPPALGCVRFVPFPSTTPQRRFCDPNLRLRKNVAVWFKVGIPFNTSDVTGPGHTPLPKFLLLVSGISKVLESVAKRPQIHPASQRAEWKGK